MFIVGYNQAATSRLTKTIIENKENIQEVYFAWGSIPSGRGCSYSSALDEFNYTSQLLEDLKLFSEAGINLNLLLNGNCYGKYSQSKVFFNKIGDIIDLLINDFNLNSVTTSSPLIAKFIKQNFSNICVRASVNMEIGSVEGMDYLADFFDGFYLKRELNRNLKAIKEIRRYCDDNGKKLSMLANSGCLNNCSSHNFHDNLVAHEHEISQMDNAYGFQSSCSLYLAKDAKREKFLSITNFIRPEDLEMYIPYFDGIKLATRVSYNPVEIIMAYIQKRYRGNLLNLLEPNHARHFAPSIIDNNQIPTDWAKKVAACDKNCSQCKYCYQILKNSLISLGKE